MFQKQNIHTVTLVNESVKEVIAISNKIYLIALNAMFLARQTDGQANAFGSVTTELRGFSDRLERQMRNLSEGIHELVGAVAEEAKDRRKYGLMLRVQKSLKGNPYCILVDRIIEEEQAHSKKVREYVKKQKKKVLLSLGKESKICHIGETLAVLAKMEAIGAGSSSNALRQIADKVDQTVNEIHEVLRRAITELDGGNSGLDNEINTEEKAA